MVFFFYILATIIWIALAFWPATVAKAKGHNFWGYLVLSIFFWWITLFIVFFFLKDESKPIPKTTHTSSKETE